MKSPLMCNLFALLTIGATAAAVAAGTAAASSTAATAASNAKIVELLKSLDACVIGSVYSFLYPSSHLPTTTGQLQASCRHQSDSFKCAKDKVKSGPALIKRGIASLVATRQRHQKKYCANVNSELSRKLVEFNKCIMEKKFAAYKRIDTEFANHLIGIKSSRLNSTALELNHLCCASYGWKKDYVASVGPECAAGKDLMEEMVNSIISSEINLICEDEDKLTSKICPKIAPLNQGEPFNVDSNVSPSTAALYLIATLGDS